MSTFSTSPTLEPAGTIVASMSPLGCFAPAARQVNEPSGRVLVSSMSIRRDMQGVTVAGPLRTGRSRRLTARRHLQRVLPELPEQPRHRDDFFFRTRRRRFHCTNFMIQLLPMGGASLAGPAHLCPELRRRPCTTAFGCPCSQQCSSQRRLLLSRSPPAVPVHEHHDPALPVGRRDAVLARLTNAPYFTFAAQCHEHQPLVVVLTLRGGPMTCRFRSIHRFGLTVFCRRCEQWGTQHSTLLIAGLSMISTQPSRPRLRIPIEEGGHHGQAHRDRVRDAGRSGAGARRARRGS